MDGSNKEGEKRKREEISKDRKDSREGMKKKKIRGVEKSQEE